MKNVEIEFKNLNEEQDSNYLYDNINIKNKKINLKTKCNKNNIIILGCLFLFILSFFLYLHSLTGCTGNEYECLSKEKIKYYYLLGIETFISSIFFSIIVSISFILKKYKLLFYFIPFIIVFIFTQGNDLQNHGSFNMMGFLLFSIIYLIISLILYKLLKQLFLKNIKFFY